MKRLIIFIFASLLFVGCTSSSQSNSFKDTQGDVIKFSNLQGKWAVINYWATWCHSCVGEIPQLNSFYERYKSKVLVLGVNYDSLDKNKLKQAIEKFHIKFPVLMRDPRKVLNLDDAGVVPTTYIINPKGRVVKQLLGPQTKNGLAFWLKQLSTPKP